MQKKLFNLKKKINKKKLDSKSKVADNNKVNELTGSEWKFATKSVISKAYPVNLDLSFAERVDTTFSIPEKVKKTYLDTLYKIGMLNEKNKDIIDTLWMNKTQLTDVVDSPSYVKKYFTHYEDGKGDKISIKEFNDNKDEFQKMGYKPKKQKIEERISIFLGLRYK